jgi:hypothetical protein
MTNEPKRVQVLFAPETYATLERLATRRGTKAQALRSAIELTDYLDTLIASGARILIDRHESNGALQEMVISDSYD